MQSDNNTTPGRDGQNGPSLDQFLVEGLRYFQRKHELDRRELIWKNIKMTGWVIFFGAIVCFQLLFFRNQLSGDTGPASASIAVIPLEGAIGGEYQASAEKVVPMIEKACKHEQIDHIVIAINSPGGSPNESERIGSAIEICRKEKGKKFTALIDGVGASAAYMVAMRTDEIVAGRYSVVGSIGAIMRYVNASGAAARLGLNERVFKSGTLKGGPSMLSPSDSVVEQVNQEMVVALGEDFLDEVYETRKGRIKAPREEVFTGRIWTAQQAKDMGLIDRVATLEELKATDFKDKKIREYKPATPFAEGLGVSRAISGAIKGVFLELEQPVIE